MSTDNGEITRIYWFMLVMINVMIIKNDQT